MDKKINTVTISLNEYLELKENIKQIDESIKKGYLFIDYGRYYHKHYVALTKDEFAESFKSKNKEEKK